MGHLNSAKKRGDLRKRVGKGATLKCRNPLQTGDCGTSLSSSSTVFASLLRRLRIPHPSSDIPTGTFILVSVYIPGTAPDRSQLESVVDRTDWLRPENPQVDLAIR